jgi:osmotically-inducible protein OsmY
MEQTMDDKELRNDVMRELEFEPSLDATHVGVTVDKGIVTLSGHVSSLVERTAAEAAVRRVRGVRALAQEIEVRSPEDKKTADDEIAKRAIDIMSWDATIPPDAVHVKVQHGWVTLTGELDWQYQKKAAEEDVHRLTGVKGVLNEIKLRPGASAPDVKHRIERALLRRANVEAKGITVRVKDGKVVLEGTVHSLDERHAVEHAAWCAPGVVSVETLLTVV